MLDFVIVYLVKKGLKFLLQPILVISLAGIVYTFYIYSGEANRWYLLIFCVVIAIIMSGFESLINRWRIPFLNKRLTVTFIHYPIEACNRDLKIYFLTFLPAVILLFILLVLSASISDIVLAQSVLPSLIFAVTTVTLYSLSKHVVIPSWSPNGSQPIKEKKFDIHLAAESNDTIKLKEIIQKNFNINQKTNKQMAALHLAIKAGSFESVKVLVEAGADIELSGSDWISETPLIMAARNNDTKILKYLLNQGANINAPGGDGENALSATIVDSEAFNFLLNNGADIRNINHDGKSELTRMMVRIPPSGEEKKEFMLQIQKLLELGIPPNGIDGEKSFPLLEAISFKNYAASKLLLKKGATANKRDQFCRTPLLTAIEDEQPKLVELLLKYGADIDLTGKGCYTKEKAMLPLDFAQWKLKSQTDERAIKNYYTIINLLKKSLST